MPKRFLISARGHSAAVVIGAGLIALSLPNGGYYPRATAIATLVAWWVVLVGCASGVLPRVRPSRGALILVGSLALFAAWMAVSLIWSPDIGKGFVDLVRASGYAGLALALVISIGQGQFRQVLVGLAAGTTAVMLIGLFSRYIPGLFDTGRAETEATFRSALGRLGFPLGYWNAFAGVAALNLIMLAGFAAAATDRRLRALLGGLVALPVLAIFLSSSRGSALSAAVGIVVLFVLVDQRQRWIAAALPGLIAGGVLVLIANGRASFTGDLGGAAAGSQGHQMLLISLAAIAAAALAVYLLDGPVGRLRSPSVSVRVAALATGTVVAIALIVLLPSRIDSLRELPVASEQNGTGHLLSGSSGGRFQFWSTAVHAFEDEPLRGIGAGGYPAYWDKHGAISAPILNAHSLPLEELAELGLIGGLLLLVAVLVSLGTGLGRFRRAPSAELALALALFAALMAQSMVDWAWQVPGQFAIAIVVAALLVAPAIEPSVARRRVDGMLSLRVVAVLAAIAAIATAGVQLFGQTKIDSAEAALNRGDFKRALSDANDATSIEPFSSVPRAQEAVALADTAPPGAAAKAISDAIDRAPQDWTLRLIAQTIDRARGDEAAAARDMEEMLHLNPQISSTADSG